MKYLMKCGHVANAIDENGKPICAFCAPDVKGVTVERSIESETSGLEGRTAHCAWCSRVTESKWTLPFFKYRPDKETDSYYCGCGSWD